MGSKKRTEVTSAAKARAKSGGPAGGKFSAPGRNPFPFRDLSQAKHPERSNLPGPITFKRVEAEASTTGYTEIHALSREQPVGYAYLDIKEQEVELAIVLTFGRYRGQGVGRALVAEVGRAAASYGCKVIVGEVSVNDYTSSSAEVAQRAEWFRSLGFSVAGIGSTRVLRMTVQPNATEKKPSNIRRKRRAP